MRIQGFRVVFCRLINNCTLTHALQKPDLLYPLHVFTESPHPLTSDPCSPDPVISGLCSGRVFLSVRMCLGGWGGLVSSRWRKKDHSFFRVSREGSSSTCEDFTGRKADSGHSARTQLGPFSETWTLLVQAPNWPRRFHTSLMNNSLRYLFHFYNCNRSFHKSSLSWQVTATEVVHILSASEQCCI